MSLNGFYAEFEFQEKEFKTYKETRDKLVKLSEKLVKLEGTFKLNQFRSINLLKCHASQS